MADIDSIARIADPAERAKEIGRRLAEVPKHQERLRAMRQAAVLEMRAARLSYAEIGRQLGLHRNRVQQIAEGRSAGGQAGAVKWDGDNFDEVKALRPDAELEMRDGIMTLTLAHRDGHRAPVGVDYTVRPRD